MLPENTSTSETQENKSTPIFAILSLGAIAGALATLVLFLFHRRQNIARQTPMVSQADSSQLPTSPAPAVLNKAGSTPSFGAGWSAPTRYIMGVFLFLASLLVLYIGRSVIPMVIAAGLITLLINPLIQLWMRQFKLRKGAAVGITYAIVLAILVAIPLLAIPPLIDAVNFFLSIDLQQVAQNLAQTISNAQAGILGSPGLATIIGPFLNSLISMLNNFAAAPQLAVPTAEISLTDVSSGLGQAFGALAKVLGPSISLVASLLFTLVMSLQMALSAEKLSEWYADLIPPGHGPELAQLFQDIRRIWTGFLRGQMTLMIIIGLITWLGDTILGLPQALFMGLIAGLMELLPSIGPVLAAIPAVIIALILGSTHLAVDHLVFALIVVIFYVLVQFMENQLIVPHVMGEAVDLPPLVVLIGTVAGAGAFGILGALLATPVIATGNLVFRYVYRKILEQPPAPPLPEAKPSWVDSIKSYLSRLRRPKSQS
jgi:predicted PurR-regulated permease PerM